MPPVNKYEYIRKVLEAADRPLSAQQIGYHLPSNWNCSGNVVGALLSKMDGIEHVTWVVGHGWKRFYYLPDNPNIKVEDL